MTITQRLAHTTQYMKEIKSWRSSMSPFLSQHDLNAPPLIPIYQRQRNMLSLAYWHTVILTNRPLLLTSFAKLTDGSRSRQLEQSERKADIDESILECLHAALEIIKIVDAMIQGKLLFRAYWVWPFLKALNRTTWLTLTVHTVSDLLGLRHPLRLHHPA